MPAAAKDGCCTRLSQHTTTQALLQHIPHLPRSPGSECRGSSSTFSILRGSPPDLCGRQTGRGTVAARCGQAKQKSTSKATLPCVNVQCQRTALQAVQSSDRWSSHCPALTCGAWAWRAPWEPAARSAARTHPAPIPPPCKQRPRKCWHSCNQGLCVRLLVLAQHPLRHPASAQQIKRPVATCNAPVQAAACSGRC